MKNERIIFCRIGWAEKYNGKEKLRGGGEYNDENIGSEYLNFKSTKGKLYGFVQPSGGYHIAIEKIDKEYKDKDKIDNVLVIWFAREPVTGGQYIVGWYKNATVYREFQIDKRVKNRSYNIIASESLSKLLPVGDRNFNIPLASKDKYGPGQSNIYYADKQDKRVKELIRKVREYIDNYDKNNPEPNESNKEHLKKK